MNYSYNSSTYFNPQNINVAQIISDVCNQWEGLTYDSNLMYFKIFVWLFVILTIMDFIKFNPFIDVYKVWKFKLFGKEFSIDIVNRKEYLSEIIIVIFIVYLFSKIVYVTYVQYFVIKKISIIDFLMLLIK